MLIIAIASLHLIIFMITADNNIILCIVYYMVGGTIWYVC